MGATSVTIDVDIEYGSNVAAGSEPHDPEESEPSELKGKIRCPSVVAAETDNDPKRSISVFLIHPQGARLT